MNNRARGGVQPAMLRLDVLGLSVLLILLAASSPAWARPALTADELKRLQRWDVLEYSQKLPGSDVMTGKAVGIIPDIPEAVVYVIEDVGRYKYFLPRIKESRVVKRRSTKVWAVLETKLPWPVKDAWAYVLFSRQKLKGRRYVVRFSMRNGTLKSFSGTALVEAYRRKDGAVHSFITYKLLTEPHTSAPDSRISHGVKRVTTQFVHRVRMRLTALRKFKKLPAVLKKE